MGMRRNSTEFQQSATTPRSDLKWRLAQNYTLGEEAQLQDIEEGREKASQWPLTDAEARKISYNEN